ncbi:hypothetical protein BLS_005008 [Venturia inaequalis]|uniref:Glycosyltransferase family 20 protein n=1 Tax=Venturia inaequalis TaxID=5025 RepID=A0A8H3URB7_VENIN|nr:hypothetical protein BLS_005008 [Venturia inaequalis]KAE9974233.1 hypothetical protein EG328_003951 [Venturia inaequalis]KAE9994290.1 hypothetical protein EG327_000136 [Venturia inaequalis]
MTAIMQSPIALLNQDFLSDKPLQGDAQETGLLSRTRTNSDDSFHAHLVSNAVPVTPGVHTAGHSAYFEQKREEGEPDQEEFHDDDASPGPNWNANNYHVPKTDDGPPVSPGLAATDAKTAQEAIRKLTMAASGDSGKKELSDVDPRAAHPQLGLSGHIISATFVVPYNISFAPGKDWELKPRSGTSALFDSFSYLASSSSPWNHTLLGWTGEIKKNPAAFPSNPALAAMENLNSTKKTSIPVEGKMKLVDPTQSTSMKVSRKDRQRLETQLERDHGGKIVPVWLVDDVSEDDDIYTIENQSRWRSFAERELYTLFHYKQNEPSDGRGVRTAWADYYKLNKLFADRIIEVYKPGDIIMIHDYNLMLLPSLIRQRLPKAYIGFFLHIPFPSSEYYRCLSRRKEILEGVLGANLIGFQSFTYSRHFSSCCTRILGFDSSSSGVDAYGVHVAVDEFPIGINAFSTKKAAYNDPMVEEKMAGILQLYAGKRIIIGRDRLDTVRGVSQKLEAFENFLERYEEWRDKVVLIQITSPNATNTVDDGGESKFMDKISDRVSKINGKYGSLSFSPVKHFPQYLSKEEYFALLRVANVALITSVRDGMNTTSMEYVVCQENNFGPLILSEFSGTSGSLKAAIQVNPWDLGGVADALNSALHMSNEERKEKHAKLYRHVVNNNVQNWTNKLFKRFLINLESFDQSFSTPALDRVKLLTAYRTAKKRLFMFDYDGTLTPIVKNPESAIPSDRVLRTLKTLAADPANTVWIVSGRDQAFLDHYMGHISALGLSAEHGCFMRQPESDDWENIAAHMDMSWQQEVKNTFNTYTDKTPGSHVEVKKVALTWHYRNSHPELGLEMSRKCQRELETTVARNHDVEVMTGKANLEVRPKFVNKGEIARRLVKAYGSGPGDAPEFVFCLGDDSTDEDMFRALKQSELPSGNVFSVTVGASSKQTLASWHLLEPHDVISCISLLNGSIDNENVGAVSVVDGTIPEMTEARI